VSDQFLPSTAARFQPPAVYSSWWSMAEHCSGVTGTLADVQWYSVPTGTVLRGDANVVAYWSSAGNHIVVDGSYLLDAGTIRHEMLHALVRRPGHPREFFLDKCAGYVPCQGNCVTEAGTATVPSGAPSVPPDSFDVEVRTTSDTVVAAENNGWFAVIVTARNRSSRTVIADLSGAAGTGTSFAYNVGFNGAVAIVGGRVLAGDIGLQTFAPGQAREQVFDLFAAEFPKGTGLASGLYNVKASAPHQFLLR
jgi:hypothetical protein